METRHGVYIQREEPITTIIMEKKQQQKNGYFLEKILGQNIVERTMEAEIDIKSKKTKDDGWANSVDSLQTI